MTGHHLPTPKPQSEHKSLSQSFFSWLNSHTSLFIGHLATTISFVILITSLIYYSVEAEHWFSGFITPLLLQDVIFWVHIAFIIFCIFYILAILDVNGAEKDRVKEARETIFGGSTELRPSTIRRSQRLLKEFKVYFLLFWISMLALYLAFMFVGFQKKRASAEKYVATFSPRDLKGDVSPTEKKKQGKESKDAHAKDVSNEDKTDQDVLVKVSEYKVDVELVPEPSTSNTKPDAVPIPQEASASNTKAEGAVPDTESSQVKAKYQQIKPYSTLSWGGAFKHIFPEFLPFALNTVSLMFVFWCLSILYIPYQTPKERLQQRRLLYFSSFIVFLLIASFPLLFELARRNNEFHEISLLEYTTTFNAVSGTLNAVVLALLIARLDSKLIGLPSALVSTLYLYAAVQPLFVVFSQPGLINEIIKTVVLLFVFILKVYFFYIIIYAMQTGRMLNYLFCFPVLNQRVKSTFENHFEISIQEKHGDRFSFTITRNHAPTYNAKHSFRSREACLAAIKRLRKLASNPNSYEVDPADHTFTVKIVQKKETKKPNGIRETLHCISVDQKSMTEAEDLITESLNYIPYCRLQKVQ